MEQRLHGSQATTIFSDPVWRRSADFCRDADETAKAPFVGPVEPLRRAAAYRILIRALESGPRDGICHSKQLPWELQRDLGASRINFPKVLLRISDRRSGMTEFTGREF
jgi:hypothetical protein